MTILRLLLHSLLVRTLVRGLLGVNVKGDYGLPRSGPAVIVANHNSHLDTLLIMSLFPMGLVDTIRPVASEDYFFRNPFIAWCITRLLRVIPIRRGNFRVSQGNPLGDCSLAIENREILVIFPEGTRGKPGQLLPLKTGIAHLAKRHPEVPFIPLFISGLETVLPKGARFPIPLVSDVQVGRSVFWGHDKHAFMEAVTNQLEVLKIRSSRNPDNRSQFVRFGEHGLNTQANP